MNTKNIGMFLKELIVAIAFIANTLNIVALATKKEMLDNK